MVNRTARLGAILGLLGTLLCGGASAKAQKALPPTGTLSRTLLTGNHPNQPSFDELIYRNDVRSELLTTGEQREKLDALKADQARERQEREAKMRAALQELGRLPDDERVEKMKAFQTQTSAQFRSTQQGLEKRLVEILQPEQMQRLRELDLRWRGELALVDPAVAEKMALTAEQKLKVQALYQEFNAKRGEIFQRYFAGAVQNRGGAAASSRPDASKTQEDLRKEEDRVRKEVGQKILAALSAEQQQRWRALQGKPFPFRTVD